MLRDEIIEKLRADQPILDGFGVEVIGVFGSVARGEDEPGSDVDILVDYRDDEVPGLFGFFELRYHLEDLTGRKVDLATPRMLHPAMKESILGEVIYA